MENASLVGLSRQVTLRRELDVIANNLANLTTTGFKAERVVFEEYMMPVARDETFRRTDRRVSFVQDLATAHDQAPGALKTTGNPLDLAIEGDAFFTVELPGGEQRYQRNGSFEINRDGELVTHEGFRVVGDSGPIRFEPTDNNINIAADGSISTVNGNTTSNRGKLKLSRFGDPRALDKDGVSTWRSNAPAEAQLPTTRVIQGAVEQSNVQPVVQLTRMMDVTRSYTTLASLMKSGDDLRQEAIKTLADVQS
ncbi:flagellar basal-body rod protein FlgF [Blastochloris viridis]|uniref:Flagellar basal-body rod protein FlgF n=1 Tax=Blastochloris viridis TaxID=1079 RepID=A0A0H5BA56_BLAVI|nr:flagellar basal-body rod protein FlgF [Blastochloris viridis]ALK08789.1 Flagellar basal-body rod protein FlgG [Blastochloris viridis]BAR97914.1 flagellar basal-body rod protein FlgF [Blastochloris viridis]CUU41450.1 Distal rod protein [Blastochloris viridis]